MLPSAGWPLSGARTLTLWRPSARTPRSPAAHPGLVGVVCAVENERSAGRGVEAAAGGRDAAELHERGLLLRHCHRGACAPRRAQAFGRELRCARAFWCDPSMRSLMRDVRRATCRCAAAARAGPSSHPGAHRARAPCLHPVRPFSSVRQVPRAADSRAVRRAPCSQPVDVAGGARAAPVAASDALCALWPRLRRRGCEHQRLAVHEAQLADKGPRVSSSN